jgi:hypothetical protein
VGQAPRASIVEELGEAVLQALVARTRFDGGERRLDFVAR